ncbi:hypothetical protein, partial [Shigella flexneri]
SDPGPVFHTIVSIKNDGHYFCRAGGNRPDGLNEPVTYGDHIIATIVYFGLTGLEAGLKVLLIGIVITQSITR